MHQGATCISPGLLSYMNRNDVIQTKAFKKYCTFIAFPILLAMCRRCQLLWVKEPQYGRSLPQNHFIKETLTNKESLLWTTNLARNKLLLCLRYYTL